MTYTPAAGDDRVRRVRLTRLLAYDIAANIASLLLLAAVWLWIRRSPAIGLLAGLVAAHLLVDLALLRRRAPAQDRSTVAVLTASTWLITLAVAPIVPTVLPILALTSLYPVVLAVPYLTRRRVPLLACLLVAVNAAMAAESRLGPLSPSGTQVPGWLTSAIIIGFTPVMAGTVALLLWHNSAWLADALRQATESNRALRRARQQVTGQAAQLRASRDRIAAAADAERRRIQRDLHDGAQQSLLAAAVTARLARQHWDTSPARAAELLDRLQADLDQATAELRRLACGIYPPVLTDLGLPAALTAAAARCPLPVTVHASTAARYPPAIEAAIYFCCLEALHNAARHAGDHARLTVTLRHDVSGLVCEVTDDGPGITGTGTGTGLANMADRIAAVGGQLRIDSAPGRGTTVRASVPARPGLSPGTAGHAGA
jgi:signal transduction histidine kinase